MCFKFWKRLEDTKNNRILKCDMPRKGSGVKCQKCPANTFTDEYNSRECLPCPGASKAPEGSTSFSSCVCAVGFGLIIDGEWILCSTWQPVHCNMSQISCQLCWPCGHKSKLELLPCTFCIFVQDHLSWERTLPPFGYILDGTLVSDRLIVSTS